MIELDGRRVARTAGRLGRCLVRAALWLAAAALPALVVATLYEAAAAQAPRVDPSQEMLFRLENVSCDCAELDPMLTAAEARERALNEMADPAPPARFPTPRPLSGPITDAEIDEAISGASARW